MRCYSLAQTTPRSLRCPQHRTAEIVSTFFLFMWDTESTDDDFILGFKVFEDNLFSNVKFGNAPVSSSKAIRIESFVFSPIGGIKL